MPFYAFLEMSYINIQRKDIHKILGYFDSLRIFYGIYIYIYIYIYLYIYIYIYIYKAPVDLY